MTQPRESTSDQLEKCRCTVPILYASFMHDACNQKTRGVSEKVPFASLDLSATPSLSLCLHRGHVVLTDWLSITLVVELASRQSASRASMRQFFTRVIQSKPLCLRRSLQPAESQTTEITQLNFGSASWTFLEKLGQMGRDGGWQIVKVVLILFRRLFAKT